MPEPHKRAFDDVSDFPHAAAVFAASRSQHAEDPHREDRIDDVGKAVTAIANEGPGFLPGPAARPLDGGQALDHFQQRLLVADVGGCRVHQQRDTRGVG